MDAGWQGRVGRSAGTRQVPVFVCQEGRVPKVTWSRKLRHVSNLHDRGTGPSSTHIVCIVMDIAHTPPTDSLKNCPPVRSSYKTFDPFISHDFLGQPPSHDTSFTVSPFHIERLP